jgi:hypothetical protein
MMDINLGVKKLFQVINHTPKLDLENEKINSAQHLEQLLAEIRSAEFLLYNKLQQ